MCGTLGCDADSIINFIVLLITNIGGLILSIFSIFSSLIDILYIFFNIIQIFLALMLNPDLIIMLILTLSNFYVSFKSNTKKEMLSYYGKYYKYVVENLIKISAYIIDKTTRFIGNIIDMI